LALSQASPRPFRAPSSRRLERPGDRLGAGFIWEKGQRTDRSAPDMRALSLVDARQRRDRFLSFRNRHADRLRTRTAASPSWQRFKRRLETYPCAATLSARATRHRGRRRSKPRQEKVDRAVRPIGNCITHDHCELRKEAPGAREIADPAAEPYLALVANDSDPEVRKNSRWALQEIASREAKA